MIELSHLTVSELPINLYWCCKSSLLYLRPSSLIKTVCFSFRNETWFADSLNSEYNALAKLHLLIPVQLSINTKLNGKKSLGYIN